MFLTTVSVINTITVNDYMQEYLLLKKKGDKKQSDVFQIQVILASLHT